jgi:hypothetical protein
VNQTLKPHLPTGTNTYTSTDTGTYTDTITEHRHRHKHRHRHRHRHNHIHRRPAQAQTQTQAHTEAQAQTQTHTPTFNQIFLPHEDLQALLCQRQTQQCRRELGVGRCGQGLQPWLQPQEEVNARTTACIRHSAELTTTTTAYCERLGHNTRAATR